ncbi:class I SAM-dependent methyltransferase [Motiliproteus sediminis]|uniref:class I SAM-dependent methyltransferase n=1 Tax=Motiliproteus sediminis TaxID=1468178 RepID=UPI001AEFB218|nr:methyltransferase domain-containing protein [Motiliproteus sediminis]
MSALRLRYQTLEVGSYDVHLRTLRDNQQYQDDLGIAESLGISSATWPLFGIIWPSGEVLANQMLVQEIEGKRILEVGCGIGLSSLLLNQRNADITATDYHPEAGRFLAENVRINAGEPIPFVRTGWDDPQSSLGQFDLIIGSDLLYEQEHAILLAGFIDQHARPACQVVMVDPGRGHHARFSKMMIARGFSHCQNHPHDTSYLERPFKGVVLSYERTAA